MRPIVLVPGFGGSKLVRKGDTNSRNRVFSFDILDKRWKNDFHYTFDKVNGLKISDTIEPYRFGSTDGVVDLCDDCARLDRILVKVTNKEFFNDMFGYKYMSDMTRHLSDRHGYKSEIDMFAAPYDFRTVMMDERYMNDLKMLIEKAVDDNGEPSVVIAHSIGCLLVTLMLVRHTTYQWRKKHVNKFVSICGPYGGCSVPASALIFGHPLVSKITSHFDEMLQCCSGLALSLPNYLAYGLETPVFYDHRQKKSYNIFMKRQLFSDSMNHLLYTYIDPCIDSLQENVGVDTKILYANGKDTPLTYIIHADERVETSTVSGDGVVPSTSLMLHHMYKYSNYTYYDIPNTDHTRILQDPQTFRLLDEFVTN
jgi:pimeloyl-ACP methyl ester carboxylesterase